MTDELFLRNREEILARFGRELFPQEDPREARKSLKAITNGFEMDSRLDAWKKKWPPPPQTGEGPTLKGKEITLLGWRRHIGQDIATRDTGTIFKLDAYHQTLVS